MWTWLAMLGAPSLALADLSLSYALVDAACSRQHGAWLHAPMAVSLALCLLVTLMAARDRRQLAARTDTGIPPIAALRPGAPALGRRRLLAWVATAAGVLSCLVVVVLWLPVLVLSPCAG